LVVRGEFEHTNRESIVARKVLGFVAIKADELGATWTVVEGWDKRVVARGALLFWHARNNGPSGAISPGVFAGDASSSVRITMLRR
jgi:hypothetical protein